MPARVEKTRGGVVAAILLAGSALGGCASGATPPAAPRGAVRATPADDEWSRLSWEERHDRMTWLVHPNMAKLFQRFEGTAFPELTCRTCHGRDAEQVQYKMPHGLPALDPARLPDPGGAGREARVAKFMFEEVTPQMAELLGVAPYDAATGRGFGCFGCHPAARGAGASR